MNFTAKISAAVVSLCPFGVALADPLSLPPQAQVSFTEGSSGTWNIDWVGGDEHRIFFVQWSLDLVTWHFAPFMEFGIDPEPYGIQTEGASKYFVRLLYYDDPEIETLEQAMNADFDKDGVSNINEVTILGTNPMIFATNGGSIGDGDQDFDFDGISNAIEIALGLDPGVSNTSSGSGMAQVQYGYDDNNRLTGITSPVSTKTFDLDEESNVKGQ